VKTMKRSVIRAFDLAAKHRAARPPPAPGLLAELAPLIVAKSSDLKTGELWIYDVIGEDWWTGGGVTAQKVIDALAQLKGVQTLNVFINSPGGDTFEGKTILTNLQRFDGDVVVHVDGVAASAASFIAMAGDRIIMAPHANMMIHEASSIAFGRAEDMRAKAELLDLQNSDMADIYAARTKRPAAEMLEMMAAETWMSAQQAVDNGFADEVTAPPADEPADSEAMAKSRLVAAVLTTEQNVRLVRQSQRLQELSKPGQPGARARPAAAPHPPSNPEGKRP
jgi:ATP-dependent Clp protease protease subunit